ncbi:hypothetical protein FRB99_004924 [Tulasnella sp. 403]|nr:hypothetical protein FRB99_004924 [Tulasnella sp. 403]
MASTPKESEELTRFREEWKREVRERVQGAHIGHDLPAADSAAENTSHSSGITSENLVSKQVQRDRQGSSSSITTRTTRVAESATHHHHTDSNGTTLRKHHENSGLRKCLQLAIELYKDAVEAEQQGDFETALSLYRSSFRLDSNVDKAYHHFTARSAEKAGRSTVPIPVTRRSSITTVEPQPPPVVLPHVPASLHDVVSSFSGLPLRFEPCDDRRNVPIAMLPDELVLTILWQLASARDVTSIERFASVNRKARLLSLDGTIWRQLVELTYTLPQISEDTTSLQIAKVYHFDYRNMFIHHPRIRTDGVYIAVCHYVRRGYSENRWVDVHHLVTYHRYLRFLPDGQVLSFLTNEEQPPSQVVHILKPSLQTKGHFVGTWRLDGSTVTIEDLLDSQRLAMKYGFSMTLELKSKPYRGRWNRLDLSEYSSAVSFDHAGWGYEDVDTTSDTTSEEGSNTTPFIVRAPFDSDSGGDCFIQAADGTKFKAFGCILSVASPVFRTMFTLPQPVGSTLSDIPVIPLSETPDVLQALLTLLYPASVPHLTPTLACQLVEVCRKYDIELPRLACFVRDLFCLEYLSDYPLECYALAWVLSLENEAKVASRYTHIGTDLLQRTTVDKLMRLSLQSVAPYLALLQLRAKREKRLDDLLREIEPSTYLCEEHRDDKRVFEFCCEVKDYIRAKMSMPYPKLEEVSELFGFNVFLDGECSMNYESCSDALDSPERTSFVRLFVQEFPQEISGFVAILTTTTDCPSSSTPTPLYSQGYNSQTPRAQAYSEIFISFNSCSFLLDIRLRMEGTSPKKAQSTATFTVEAPFDASSDGDCFIQTVDGTKFKTLRCIPAVASPVFRTMFTLPQPVDPAPADLPVTPVSEAPDVMQALLAMLYPTTAPHIPSHSLAFQLVEACNKYEIPILRLTLFARDLFSPEELRQHPLELYALAWVLNMEREAKIASRYTHNADLLDRTVVNKLQRLSMQSTRPHLALLQLRALRDEKVDDLLQQVKPQTFLCEKHMKDGVEFSSFCIMKKHVKMAMSGPHPRFRSAGTLFGMWSILNGPCCKSSKPCVEVFNASREAAFIRTKFQQFPQEISGFPSIAPGDEVGPPGGTDTTHNESRHALLRLDKRYRRAQYKMARSKAEKPYRKAHPFNGTPDPDSLCSDQ